MLQQHGCLESVNVVVMQAWQGAALDALAAWLSEDASRVEPRLAAREACQRFVALFAAYAPSGDSEALSRLLKPFLRILRHSKRITVSIPCPLSTHMWLHRVLDSLPPLK